MYTLPVPPETEDDLDERSVRARTQRMAVSATGTSTYEVESESGNTYLVDVDDRYCTCPDYLFRGAHCKHLRRVAIEITEGRVPPPGMLDVACAVCGESTFVPVDAREPHYCPAHRLSTGSIVRDRETGDRLLVVTVSSLTAEETYIDGADCTVAEYRTNRNYPDDDPVVGAVYPWSVRMSERGPEPESLRVYSFPRSRLEPVDNFSDA